MSSAFTEVKQYMKTTGAFLVKRQLKTPLENIPPRREHQENLFSRRTHTRKESSASPAFPLPPGCQEAQR